MYWMALSGGQAGMRDSWTRYRVNSQDEGTTTGLVAALAEHGLVLLDGVTASDDLLRLAHSIAMIMPHRDSDTAGLTTIAEVGGKIRSGFVGFSACALNPHTDRSGIAHPPALLMMSCGQPASTGGECFLIDGKAV
jgi:alpha-ketoglutarate-dependent taurine dioxygenase